MKEDIDKIKKQNWPTWVKLVITAVIGVITALTIFFTSCNPLRVVAKEQSTVQIENYHLDKNDVQDGNDNKIDTKND